MAAGREAEPTTRDARFIKTAVEILRRNRAHRLHRARSRRPLQDITARLLSTLQQQGRTADRAAGADDGAVGAGLARRDRRPGQHVRDQADHRPHQRRTRIEHARQPEPGDEPLQPASGRNPPPRLRPGARSAARTRSRRRPARHHRRHFPAQPRRRARRGDRHADHPGRTSTALAGSRIDRCANRCGAPIRLLHPRAGHRRRASSRKQPTLASCSTRSVCARVRATANSR